METYNVIKICALLVFITICVCYYVTKAVKNNWVDKIKETLMKACKEAEEQWPEGHGNEKKFYVLNKVESLCDDLDIPFSVIKTAVLKLIEQIVSNYNNFIK